MPVTLLRSASVAAVAGVVARDRDATAVSASIESPPNGGRWREGLRARLRATDDAADGVNCIELLRANRLVHGTSRW